MSTVYLEIWEWLSQFSRFSPVPERPRRRLVVRVKKEALPMTRRSLVPLTFIVLLAIPGLTSASHKHGASVDIISLPLQLLAGLGGTMNINCDSDVDSDTAQ
jgi:hypothetical protein